MFAGDYESLDVHVCTRTALFLNRFRVSYVLLVSLTHTMCRH